MSATVYCPQWRTLYSNHFDKKLLSADLSPCLRHSQAPPPVVSYPPAPVPAAAQPHSNDGRYGDKLHGLSESLSRIDGRLTSQRDREEAGQFCTRTCTFSGVLWTCSLCIYCDGLVQWLY
eukprot:scpid111505/ scgid5811/ 